MTHFLEAGYHGGWRNGRKRYINAAQIATILDPPRPKPGEIPNDPEAFDAAGNELGPVDGFNGYQTVIPNTFPDVKVAVFYYFSETDRTALVILPILAWQIELTAIGDTAPNVTPITVDNLDGSNSVWMLQVKSWDDWDGVGTTDYRYIQPGEVTYDTVEAAREAAQKEIKSREMVQAARRAKDNAVAANG